ncbi:hypothetical protein [Aureimonas sp. AU40]|uniref:hypothetical protein n=1 Tax=Aureimonas sp. AU40 TaxID=1637747 RepID=UPI0007806EAF|nr:hypothetical protein [Aureimonas sp. AU40]
MIDGTFPAWQRVVPAVGAHELLFNGRSAARFLRAVKGITKERGRAVTIRESNVGVAFKMQAADYDIEFADMVEGSVSGEPRIVGLNAGYLAAIIKVLGGGDITLNMTDQRFDAECADSPIRITSTNSAEGDIVVLMPMRV